MKWLWQRLNEASTWNSIGGATIAVGASLGSGQTLIGALVPFVLGFIMKDKGAK